MTRLTTKNTLPPLLERFHTYTPGDIHSAAAKVHLITGFEACKGNTLADAVWNEDKTALELSFADGSQATLLVQGFRLLTKCNCKQWQPARNCPHVVIAWAILKRTVTPGSLSHINFNRKMLDDIKQYVERDAPPPVVSTAPSVGERNQEVEQATSGFRVRITHSSRTGELSGCVMNGSRVVSGWTDIGIPTDLARFMASVSNYESTPRYFETFLRLTAGKYPIVFSGDEGTETPLVYHADEPRSIRIAFDICRDNVTISPFLEDVGTVVTGFILQEGVLFVPERGCMYPLAQRSLGKQWQQLVDLLGRGYEAPGYENVILAGDDGLAPFPPAAYALESFGGQTVTVPIAQFNAAGLRLTSELFTSVDDWCLFFHNGMPATVPEPESPTYLLGIPSGGEGPSGSRKSKKAVSTLGVLKGQTFPCSTLAQRILNPALRTNHLSPALRNHTRVRALLEAHFELMNDSGPVTREAVIRSMGYVPDFSTQEMAEEVMPLLSHLSDDLNRVDLLLLASADGWLCAKEVVSEQVRMLKVLYDVLAFDAFCALDDRFALGARKLDMVLPQLISRLQSAGFAIKVDREPLALGSWEFSLDATVSTLDWFELRPEIRCDGVVLSEEELRALFESNGSLRRNGYLMTMDEDTARAFALLSDCMPTHTSKTDGGKGAVRVPRLQILDWLQLRSQGVTVTLSPKEARVLESLLNFKSIPERPLPSGLHAELRHYQVESWYWLAYLYEHHFGACLADDMGLGKTLQGITLMAGLLSGGLQSTAPPGTPHLVVAPPSLLFNWEAEIGKFYPAARVHVYSGSGRSTEALTDYDIVITSYGLVQRDIDRLEKVRFDVIIFDETQVVKNLQAVTSNAVRRLSGGFTLGLTGTPVENHLREYYAIMDLCLPGLLGSRDDFTRQSGQGEAGIARLIRRTRPFILRRTKQMIAAELPPKIETDILLDLSEKQKALNQRTVEEVRGQVKDAYDRHVSGQASIIALTAILRLRQICLTPALLSPDSDEESPKLEFLVEQLRELRDEGHSALVFSQFTGYLDHIEKGLQQQELDYLRLDGSTPVPKRKKLVQQFQDSEEPSVFLISLKAGGRGLNLTRATYVYHMDPWWNPAVENQASDRAHRIGQTEQVTITRLIMRHTIEEKMMMLKQQKLKLYKAILEEGTGAGGAGLTREDLEFLLR